MIPINPVPRTPVKFGVHVEGEAEVSVDVTPPGELEKVAPPSIGRTILIRFVVILMVSVFAMMLYLGVRQFNPYMMMGMLMMLTVAGGAIMGGGGGLFGGGKNPQGEMAIKRQEYAIHLREQRSNAHTLGRHIHSTQTAIYPHPDTLESRCGDPTLMWTTTPADKSEPSGLSARAQAESAQTNPWGTARIGVGYRRMDPYITPKANQAPEIYEPVQAAGYMRFIRTHNVIPDCPIGVDIFSRALIVCAGDKTRLLDAARAMICSLADNHKPSDLQIGIIAADVAEWDWLKWLPHVLDSTRRDKNGPARLHWSSVADYSQDQAGAILAGQPHSPTRDNRSGNPYRVIFVDVPGQSPELPHGVSPAGLADHTFIYVRHS